MADDDLTDAPDGPGIAPTWTSSAKDLVSTALGSSRIWASFGHGIVNEVYWPSTGQPQIRDLGFIVKGPAGWTEIKRAQRYVLTTPGAHVPLPKFVHEGDDYRLTLECLPHPLRDALLIRYALEGDGAQLYVLLSPHLQGDDADNVALAGQDLATHSGAVAICLRADTDFTRTSAGYAGASDGWTDFDRHGEMTWDFERARNGNLALIGELAATTGTLALAFAPSPDGARTLARASLADDYDTTRTLFVTGWQNWGRGLQFPYTTPELRHEAELSAALIKVHEDRTYNGAIVASLSVPWGRNRNDPGGYHLVWTRDAVEAALALITVGKPDDAARVLAYLIATQAPAGNWAQNYFPSGEGYWTGKQLDEVALPVLLAAKLMDVGQLVVAPPVETMIRSAIGYIVRNGPITQQDRWEENAGASPFTLSVLLAAMVSCTRFFAPDERAYLLALADCWNERIESWTLVTDAELCSRYGVAGYYVRLGPRVTDGGLGGTIEVRNRLHEEAPARQLLGLEFLALVRAGIRRADDPRIVDTMRLVDTKLRVETPSGPSFHRYEDDGYGEHEDGSAYDGTGIGRLWPLLTGERGHFALAAGQSAAPYLDAMLRMTGPGGLIPEQIWDGPPMPERGLYPGKPSGSAMPLVWAHAEFLKLIAAQASGRPVELMDAVVERWNREPPRAARWFWRRNSLFRRAPHGRELDFEDDAPFTLGLSVDGGAPTRLQSAPGQFGLHQVAVAADTLAHAGRLDITLTRASGEAVSDHIELFD
jgi:glucoamylase